MVGALHVRRDDIAEEGTTLRRNAVPIMDDSFHELLEVVTRTKECCGGTSAEKPVHFVGSDIL